MSDKLRTVKVWKDYKREQLNYTGYFHKFFEDPDSESCAIIEKDDGTIELPSSNLIQFTNKANS